MTIDVSWDYSDLAAHYDKRADYSPKAIDGLLSAIAIDHMATVADIGAGTGKLALPLAHRGCRVFAIEPNAAMRGYGIQNTAGLDVAWGEGTGEETGLPPGAFDLATFGSSFNVVDQIKALNEVARILKPLGQIACMWNHRDLRDPVQADVETLIRQEIPGYDYGSRRQDPTSLIAASALFGQVCTIEERFVVGVPTADYIEAWRSHGTLQRQAGSKFTAVIAKIEIAVGQVETLSVPYFTRIWYAQRARS